TNLTSAGVVYPAAGAAGFVGAAVLALLVPARRRRVAVMTAGPSGTAAVVDVLPIGSRLAGNGLGEEIRRRVGWPVLGRIPKFVPAPEATRQAPAGGPPAILCTLHAPDSRPAEAYRGLRTALLVATGEQRSIIQITAPETGEG